MAFKSLALLRCTVAHSEMHFFHVYPAIQHKTIAYREGVVVAICKGCKSKHLIADNLGTAGLDGDTNIEDYFKARGMEDSVNRVTQEVFELEKILDFDSLSGSLFGEKGKPVLE